MAFGGENAESYYDEGVTASMKGDLAQAIKHFERTIQLDNSYAVAYHQLGKCYLRLGRAKKAVTFLREVTSKKPNMIPARVDLGFGLLAMGNVEEARRTFMEIREARPDNARAQLGLGHCAYCDGNYDEAMVLSRNAVNNGGASFASLFLLGRAATLAGRPDTATEALGQADALLEKSIETNPDQPEGYYLRGELHFVREEYVKALDNYRSAEDRADPEQHYAAYGEHFTRLDMMAKHGLCLVEIGRRDAAQEVGERILKVDPDDEVGKMLTSGESGA